VEQADSWSVAEYVGRERKRVEGDQLYAEGLRRIYRRCIPGVNALFDELFTLEFLLDHDEQEEYLAFLAALQRSLLRDYRQLFGDAELPEAAGDFLQAHLTFSDAIRSAIAQIAAQNGSPDTAAHRLRALVDEIVWGSIVSSVRRMHRAYVSIATEKYDNT
jgi:hypothetical protein